MAENARPFGALLPSDGSPAQTSFARRLAVALKGRGGIFVGRSWRLMEAPYPNKNGPACLHFQVNASSGWRTVFVVKPDGTFEGVAP